MKKKIIQLLLTFTGLLAASFPVTAAKNPGEIAENFTVKKRPEGTDLSLADYAGHVIMLDFFAYWCPPCQSSSPDVEENIAKYYQNAGGNQNGIPVTVIAVNIEDDNPQLTDDFIESAGTGVGG
ncbi:MAG: redoxin family protein [Oceanipulchritudo sp.]